MAIKRNSKRITDFIFELNNNNIKRSTVYNRFKKNGKFIVAKKGNGTFLRPPFIFLIINFKANLKRDINSKWQHDMFDVIEKQIEEMESKAAELFLSNLHYDVSESDLFDLFSLIGRLLSVRIDYDTSGRSLGKRFYYWK